MRMRSRAGAFTLLELLAVVAIIVVLGSLATAAYNRIQARVVSSKCQSNLRQLGVALNLYLAEHSQTLPTMAAARADASEDVPALDTVLAPYLEGQDVFLCPGDRAGIGLRTGTSYFWNSLLNGQKAGNERFFGLRPGPAGVPVFSDKENFHESVGQEVNILYADGHVASEVQFSVGGRR